MELSNNGCYVNAMEVLQGQIPHQQRQSLTFYKGYTIYHSDTANKHNTYTTIVFVMRLKYHTHISSTLTKSIFFLPVSIKAKKQAYNSGMAIYRNY